MKKLSAQSLTTSLIATSLVLTFSSVAFAQTPTTTVAPTTTTSSSTPPGRADKATIKDNKVTLKRQTLLEKIASIKDTKKKSLVEKIDSKVGDINQKRTSQMSQAITRMNNILVELTSKSALAKAQGQDTSKLTTALTAAQLAVKSAETAIATQAAKEYTLSITTESALRTTVGATVKTLQTDLRSTHAAVVNAKKKIILAVIELAKLNGRSTDKEASASAEDN